MTIKAILFDLDGTLVDSNDFHVQAWQAVFAQMGQHFDAATIHDQIGKGADMLVPALMPMLDQDAQDRLGEAHGVMFKNRFLHEVKPFAEAHELLAFTHQSGIRVVLASSASMAELDHYIDQLDARTLVAATTSADDVEATKPAPDIFATALKKLKSVDSAEVLVVGDTPYDMEAAGRCGIAAVALRSGGFAEASLTAAGAVALYDDAADLLAAMKGGDRVFADATR